MSERQDAAEPRRPPRPMFRATPATVAATRCDLRLIPADTFEATYQPVTPPDGPLTESLTWDHPDPSTDPAHVWTCCDDPRVPGRVLAVPGHYPGHPGYVVTTHPWRDRTRAAVWVDPADLDR